MLVAAAWKGGGQILRTQGERIKNCRGQFVPQKNSTELFLTKNLRNDDRRLAGSQHRGYRAAAAMMNDATNPSKEPVIRDFADPKKAIRCGKGRDFRPAFDHDASLPGLTQCLREILDQFGGIEHDHRAEGHHRRGGSGGEKRR